MKNIRLPAYGAIVPNEVYGKRAEDITHSLMGRVPATQIISLSRVRVPAVEEVINFIRSQASEIDPSFLEEENLSAEGRSGAVPLLLLPASEIKGLVNGDEEILGHLRRHYSGETLQEGRVYLRASSGIVPNPILGASKTLASREGAEVYDLVIGRTSLRSRISMIRLSEDGKSPDRSELKYLMDRGVRDCDVFCIRGDFGNYQEIADQIMMLHNSLGSTGLVSQVRDASHQLLEQRAALVVNATARCIAESGAIEKLFGEIEEKRYLHGESDYCSPN